MKSFVVFSLLFVAAFGYPFDVLWDESDVFEGIEKRIVGGEVAQPKQFPYQVRMHLQKISGGRIVSSLCGGAVISNKVVLTAAHCLLGAIGGTLYLGVTNIQKAEPTRVVINLNPSYFHIHPEYSSQLFVNDIALIILENAIKTNDGIQVVRLPGANLIDLDNRMGVISGFGKTGDKFGPSDSLRFVKRKILPETACHSHFARFMPNTQICVDGSQKKSACPGDSGGPLVITDDDGIGTLVGVTSYGKMSCESGSPAVYTRLSAYLGWINKLTSIPIRK